MRPWRRRVALSVQAGIVEVGRARAKPLRRGLDGAGLLSLAMLGSGVLAYAFQVVAARTLGPDAYGQVGVLWAAMFIAVIVFFRPLEQTGMRAVADRHARNEEVRTVLRSVVAIYAGVLAVGSVALVWTWRTIADRLFLGSDFLTAMLVAGIAGYGAAYVLRGLLGGSRWYRGYGLCLMADAVARLAVALPLVLVASKNLAAAAVAAAAFGGLIAPLVVGHRRLRAVLDHDEGERFAWGSALAFAGPATAIAAADQVLVNGGPLLVMLGGGKDASKTAGVVFAATMLVRVPVYVFQGVAASLLPNLTRLHAVNERGLFRRTVVRAAGVLLATGLVIVAFTAAIGPRAMSSVFGSGFDASRTELTLLAVGVACYLASATISQALLALHGAGRTALAWSASAAVFLALFAVFSGSGLFRTAAAFAIASAACTVLLVFALVRRL